jgi:primosomal protein N' (replication factor Y)
MQVAVLCRKSAQKNAEILGPAPSPIDRIRDRYRWQVLLKGEKGSALHQICAEILEQYQKLTKGDIRISIDVDPESMM